MKTWEKLVVALCVVFVAAGVLWHPEVDGGVPESAPGESPKVEVDNGVGDYWHCKGAPSAPGIPPPLDPDHWEEVTEAEAAGEYAFGHAGEGAEWEYISDIGARGTVFPFPSGTPTESHQHQDLWRIWPESITTPWEVYYDRCYSIYCTYDHATGLPQTIRAYLKRTQVTEAGKVSAAVYTEAGDRVAYSGWQVFTTGTGWLSFDVSGGATPLSPGSRYVLLVQGDFSALDDLLEVAIDSFANYQPPPQGGVPEWDPDANYTLCNYVHYENPSVTVEETLYLADSYIRASRCWGRYDEPDVECENLYDDDDQQNSNLYREI